MCVIVVCQEIAPTREVLEACRAQNPQGVGIAWRDKDGIVNWEKGLDISVQQVMDKISKLKFPYVIHFRVASVGGACQELCHPFPYGAQDQRGRGASKYGVVFHNGTFHSWKHEMKQAAYGSNTPIPDGRWSDSRALAYLAGIYRTGIFELLDEKVVALTPRECTIYGTLQQGWTRRGADGETVKAEEPGIWFSNDLWEKKVERPGSNVHGSFHRDAHIVGRGGFHMGARGAGSTDLVGSPRVNPWKKPTECDHAGTCYWMEGRRFCTPCGIRLDNAKNEPWMTTTEPPKAGDTKLAELIRTTPDDTAVEAALKMLADGTPTATATVAPESIARRVKKLCLAAGIREMGHA